MSDDEIPRPGPGNEPPRRGSENKNEKKQNEETENEPPKDAAKRIFRPLYVNRKGAGITPMGVISVQPRREVRITVTSEELPPRDVLVSLDRNDITVEYPNKGLNVLVRREDEPSVKGIGGGLITRLTLTKGEFGDEEIVAHFDDGEWKKPAETFLANQVIMEAKERDNGILPPPIRRDFDKTNDPDIDL